MSTKSVAPQQASVNHPAPSTRTRIASSAGRAQPAWSQDAHLARCRADSVRATAYAELEQTAHHETAEPEPYVPSVETAVEGMRRPLPRHREAYAPPPPADGAGGHEPASDDPEGHRTEADRADEREAELAQARDGLSRTLSLLSEAYDRLAGARHVLALDVATPLYRESEHHLERQALQACEALDRSLAVLRQWQTGLAELRHTVREV